jgi:alpha-amylase/alpha-mannosidase (GH57 family)
LSDHFVCVHGHFYQPPRESPWLESIELQDSAYPYHDWNERISVECYAPNGVARILDSDGRIVQIRNNYERISFNFGPTLLAWMEENDPETYGAVLEADRRSIKRFGGHGSALAQPYNHVIMPLANERDRRTQVEWGLADFRRRFGREPEGMWLPETAVDLGTLSLLVEYGMRFTILAPHQAARFRRLGDKDWKDVNGARIDPRRPYVQRLPDGGEITLFFYDGPVARAVAFEGLLRDGGRFAKRLTDASGGDDGLVHIATDGETYGHHHRYGDMALAFALEAIDNGDAARLTNYGRYLEEHPPEYEVEIHENTSWSCAHGIERWRSDCGCSAGRGVGWNQAWRGPLRDALDWLRDELAPLYDERAGKLLQDPWAARNAYIDVVLNRAGENVQQFLDAYAAGSDVTDVTDVLKLLELQRHAMLMYTSCGWFFDEISGIETVQVLQYAGRVIQLADELFDAGLESEFLERLEKAPSNLPEYGNGRRVYEALVWPAMVDLRKVGAHHAISLLFRDDDDENEGEDEGREVYAFEVEDVAHQTSEAGRARLAVGRLRISSRVTLETSDLVYAVLHLGDHTVTAGVQPFTRDQALERLRQDLNEPFDRADFPEALRALDRAFPDGTYSLSSLFRDQQRLVLDKILESTLHDAESVYRQVYERHAPLMRYLTDLNIPLPNALELAAEYVLNTSLIRAVSDEDLEPQRVLTLLKDAQARDVKLDQEGLGYALEGTLERLADRMLKAPKDVERVSALEGAVRLATAVPFRVNTWSIQNAFWELKETTHPEFAGRSDDEARTWLSHYRALGKLLRVAV